VRPVPEHLEDIMANKTQYGRIAQISMTAAQWALTDAVLNTGEVGYDTTNQIFKTGDGVHTWANLPYNTETSEDTGITCSDFVV